MHFAGFVFAVVCVVILCSLLSASQDPPQKVVSHFRVAQQAAETGDLDLAVIEYRTVLSLDPTKIGRASNPLTFLLVPRARPALRIVTKQVRSGSPQLPAGPTVWQQISLGKTHLNLGRFDVPQAYISAGQAAASVVGQTRKVPMPKR